MESGGRRRSRRTPKLSQRYSSFLSDKKSKIKDGNEDSSDSEGEDLKSSSNLQKSPPPSKKQKISKTSDACDESLEKSKRKSLLANSKKGYETDRTDGELGGKSSDTDVADRGKDEIKEEGEDEIVEEPKPQKKRGRKRKRPEPEKENTDIKQEKNNDTGEEDPVKNFEKSRVWEATQPQLQTLVNILKEAGIQILLMTNWLRGYTFQYGGSEKGVRFLEERVGFPEEYLKNLNNESLKNSQKGEHSKFIWKIVEKQLQNLVSDLLAVGIESLVMSSVVGLEEYGFTGSFKGLQFLGDRPELKNLFIDYCSEADIPSCKFMQNSVFMDWYQCFGGEIYEEEFYEPKTISEGDPIKIDPKLKKVKVDNPLDVTQINESDPNCPVCFRKCASVSDLKNHYLIHYKDKEFACEICSKTFPRKVDVEKHLSQAHEKEENKKCHSLWSDDKNVQEVEQDMSDVVNCFLNTNDSETIVPENIPQEMNGDVSDKDSAEIESESVVENEIENLNKEMEETDEKPDRKTLVESPIQLAEGKIQCPSCNKILKNDFMYRKHVETHFTKKDVPCRVEGCKKKFKRAWDMEYHMVTIHNYVKIAAGMIVHPDDVPAGTKLKKVKRKKRKGEVIEESEEEEFNPIKALKGTECPDCHMKFKTLAILKRHYEIHIGKKTFICEVCSKTFLRKYDMQIHQMKVHGYKKLKKGEVGPDDNDKIDNSELFGSYTHSQSVKKEPMICQYCGHISLNLTERDTHLDKFHSDQNPFKCDKCDLTFPLKRKMKVHYYMTHAKKKHKCSQCDECFTFRFHLREHEQMYHNENGFLCTLCGKSFMLLKYLKKHEQRHQENIAMGINPDDPKFYQCPYCNETCEGVCAYQHHLKLHPDVAERKFPCQLCNKKFFQAGHLKRHLFVHASERQYKCELCNKTYKDPDTLKKHRISVHNLKTLKRKSYRCEDCDKGFLSAGHLRRHMQGHTGEKPFSCEYCDKRFTEKAGKLAHERIHTGDRPFTCQICRRNFIQASHLRRHMFLHTQIRNFVCQICKKGFFQNDDLKKHLMTHLNQRPYKCQYCDKSFFQMGSLKAHERCHTGEKPFQCSVCKACFTQKNTMIIHMRRHTGNKPFKCSECGKCFYSKYQCQQHAKAHLETTSPLYKCSACDNTYCSEEDLRDHIKKEHPSENQNDLVQVVIIQNDEVINEEEDGEDAGIDEAFIGEEEEEGILNTCEICLLSFPDNQSLEKHKIEDHKNENICEVCFEAFEDQSLLADHLVKDHGFIEIDEGQFVQLDTVVGEETESPSKYLNVKNELPNEIHAQINGKSIIIQNVMNEKDDSLIPIVLNNDQGAELEAITGEGLQAVQVIPRKAATFQEKDGSILHIVSPNLDVSTTTVTSTTTTQAVDKIDISEIPVESNNIPLDPSLKQENQVIIATMDGGQTYFTLPSATQEQEMMETTIEDMNQETAEEVISTVEDEVRKDEMPIENQENALSEFVFDQDGGISETTAANLAAMYGTDRIIFQEEQADGTEVVHVYAVVQD